MAYKNLQLLQRYKDSALTYTLRLLANILLKRYAAVLKIELDSATKRLSIDVLLKGEHDPITIHIERYTLHSRDGINSISLQGVTTSREWLNALLETLTASFEFELPPNFPLKLLECLI